MDAKSLFVIRHETFEHLGHFASILETRGWTFVYHDLGEPIPDENYRAVIILGGPMSANDDLAGLKAALKLIERALRSGTPLLGVCLGSQLIAKALGARVYRNAALEIGWKPVYLTESGRSDPLFSNVPSPSMFFHWHGETFDLPAGAELLAWSDLCRNQAYRYGDRVHGIQFHPEITAEMIEEWQRQPVNCGDVAKLDGPIDARAFDSWPAAERIVNGWIDSWAKTTG